jgi:hypothetical protein
MTQVYRTDLIIGLMTVDFFGRKHRFSEATWNERFPLRLKRFGESQWMDVKLPVSWG